MSAAAILFKHQTTRPPTPPLENETDFDLDACETGLALLDSKHLAYNTPDDSPNSNTEFMGKSPEERSAKRVDFVLIPSHIARNTRKGSRVEELKPRRSILKQPSSILSSDPPSSDIIASVEDNDFPAMLEHLIRGLASQDVSARYDAYMSINGCLKTYSDTPSKQSLAEKMSRLDGYLRRDLVVEIGAGVRASQMVTEALKFVTSLCWFPETKSIMTTAFQVFLLNHAITVLGKEDTPKMLANLYLYFFSVQTFPSRVMNQEKVVRILSVLKGVAERIQGRQSAAHRLAIYKRLIGQAKQVMAIKANDWVEDMFNNMISKSKDVRERAIAVGFIAGQCYGSESDLPVADAMRRLMNNKHEETEKTYIDDVITRLQSWLDTKQDIAEIPSIWSIVILLLRSKPNFPERWEHFPRWLRLIQGCLNINDPKTRSEANLAWIRLIYTISPKDDTSKTFSSLLFRPMKKQLERQEREKDSSGQLRKNVDSAYITLLYYAFRPGSDHRSLDRYWQEYIVPVFCQRCNLPIDDTVACRILIALFSSKQQVWQAGRALDTTDILSPAELPRVDFKWLRSRAKMISAVLIMHIHKLRPSEAVGDSSWKGVWAAWLDAVKLAGAKEIKVSAETMNATIEMVDICRKTIDAMTTLDFTKMGQVAWIIAYLHEQLGNLPFLEERILETKEGQHLELVADRSKQATGTVRSALTILNKSIIAMLDRVGWIVTAEEKVLPVPESMFTYLSTATKLLQAGCKSLPLDIRHSSSGQTHTKLLDTLHRASQVPSQNTGNVLLQLLDIARWFDRRVDGILPETSEDLEKPDCSAQGEVSEDTIVVATPKAAPRKLVLEIGDKPEREHQPQSKTLISAKVTTPDASSRRRRPASPFQQPRIRHDNSQIEFASIDSSPSILQAMDSQLMTDRQKEVKQRQEAESGSLFRDVSSSSGPKSRNENTPRLQLGGHDRAKSGRERLGSSSPILPPADSMVVFLGSSPTPSQRRTSSGENLDPNIVASVSSEGTSMMHFSLDDPPSSPPAEALKALNRRSTANGTREDMMSYDAGTSTDNAGSTKDSSASAKVNSSTASNAVEECAMPPHFLSSAADKHDIDQAWEPLNMQNLPDKGPIPMSSSPAQELEIVDALSYTPESEDDDLISSQIDRDLKHASQDTVIVESPMKQKQRQAMSQSTPNATPQKSRKRSLPGTGEVEAIEQRTKRVKVVEPEPIHDRAASQDIVAQLETFLNKAKGGMTASQGFEILRMSAELTQLAVQAVQGGHG